MVLSGLNPREATLDETPISRRRPDMRSPIPLGESASQGMLALHQDRIQGDETTPRTELDLGKVHQCAGLSVVKVVQNTYRYHHIEFPAQRRRFSHRSNRELAKLTEPGTRGFDVFLARVETLIPLFSEQRDYLSRSAPDVQHPIPWAGANMLEDESGAGAVGSHTFLKHRVDNGDRQKRAKSGRGDGEIWLVSGHSHYETMGTHRKQRL